MARLGDRHIHPEFVTALLAGDSASEVLVANAVLLPAIWTSGICIHGCSPSSPAPGAAQAFKAILPSSQRTEPLSDVPEALRLLVKQGCVKCPRPRSLRQAPLPASRVHFSPLAAHAKPGGLLVTCTLAEPREARLGGMQRHQGLCGHAAFRIREIRLFCAAVSLRIVGGPGGL